MQYQWTSYSLLALISATMSLVLLFYVLKRKKVPGSISFMVLMLAISQWSLCEFTHILFTDLDMILFWSKFSYVGIVIAPVAWFSFAKIYSGKDKIASSSNSIYLLLIIPLITLVMVFTNQYHSLIWDNIALAQKGSIVYYTKDYGLWFYINMLYSYALLFLGTYYIIDPFTISFTIYRKQKVFLLIGIVVPWIANIVYIMQGSPIYSLDMTPLTFLISSSVMLYSFFNYGFLDILPIAQKNILENIRESVLVLDLSRRIVHLNKSAQKLLGTDKTNLYGKDINEAMPNWDRLQRFLGNIEIESLDGLSVREKIGDKYYDCNLTALKQKRNVLGCLLIIRDVTMSVDYENRIRKLNEHLKIINKILRHDISNHLTVAAFSLEMLKTSDTELKDRSLRSISKSIDLINRMKELEIFISKHGSLKKYKMSDVINEIIKGYPEISFNVEGDCTAMADEAILSVIDNLISNAKTHGKTDKIDIEIGIDGDLCIIKVIDYGLGIPDKVKDNIFNDEFSYGDNKGSGIGLFIAKKTMERYGGDIMVSDNIPQGMIFTLLLRRQSVKEDGPY